MNFLNNPTYNGLVKVSVIWSWLGTWPTWSEPLSTLSLTKNKSNSTCLNLECRIGFPATATATELSNHTKALLLTGTYNSNNKDWSQIIFVVTCTRLLYSILAMDLETTYCFLELQETRFPLRNIRYHEVDLWSSRSEPQFASKYPWRKNFEAQVKHNPWSKVSCK